MSHQYKAVIADLDGTLYRRRCLKLLMALGEISNLKLLLSERKARKELAGMPVSGEDALMKELFCRMAEHSGKTPEAAERWYRGSYMPRMVSIIGRQCKPDADVLLLLDKMKSEGAKLAVLSDYGACADKLDALGIDMGRFDIITCAAAEGGLKPCKDAFLSVCSKLDVLPQDTLVVGDREDTDGAGASAAGMDFMKI